MSIPEPPPASALGESFELSLEGLVRDAAPFPSYEEMVIEDLTDEEEAAFIAAIDAR